MSLLSRGNLLIVFLLLLPVLYQHFCPQTRGRGNEEGGWGRGEGQGRSRDALVAELSMNWEKVIGGRPRQPPQKIAVG